MAAKKIQPVGEELSLKSIAKGEGGATTATESQFNNHLKGLLKETRASNERQVAPSLTYGHTVLSHVVFGRYEAAIDDLDKIMELKEQYPDFGISATRYIQHAKSLVRALKAKRAIGKLPHVSRAKQKELIATLTAHFEDLRACVINIEKIERQIRKVDLSSTRYFLAISYWACFGVFVAAAMIYALPLYAYSIHAYVTEILSTVVITLVNWVWPF